MFRRRRKLQLEAETLEAGPPCPVRDRLALELRRRIVCAVPAGLEDTPLPGAWEGVADADYRGWDAVSQSRVKTLEQFGQDVEQEETEAMRLGTAYHEAVLEGAEVPDGMSECRPWVDASVAALDEWHPDWTADSSRELSLVWACPVQTSVMCKGRLDLVLWSRKTIVDLKTTRGSAASFANARKRFGYDLQALHYLIGARATGIAGAGWKWAWLIQPKNGSEPSIQEWTPSLDDVDAYLRSWDTALGVLAKGERRFDPV